MNWKQVLDDLAAAGMTQMEISKAVGLSQPAISDLARGRTARVEWSVGEALRRLHVTRCEKKEAA